MTKVGFKKIAELILEDTNKSLSPKEIWNKAKISRRPKIREMVKRTKGKTPWDSIGAEIYRDLNKSDSVFYQPSKGVAKFYLAKYK